MIEAQSLMAILLLNSILCYTCSLFSIDTSKSNKFIFYLVLCFISTAISWLFILVCGYLNIVSLVLWCEIGIGIMLFGYSLIKMEKKNKKAFFLFLIYLIALFMVTIGARVGVYKPWIKLDLLGFLSFNLAELKHFALNVIMFVPFGLLPIINRKYGYRSGIIAIVASVWIETVQLMLSIGECDIADIAGNTLGMLIGITLSKYFLKENNE